MSNTLQIEISNNVATIRLNRPEVFNSFNREMALALQTVLDDVEKDDTVRAMVLTGNGKAFCAGQDLKEVTSPEQNPGFKKILEEHYNPIIARIRSIEKPILAAVNGVAAGAGANIALACDEIEISNNVATIRLNRPEVFNSFNREMALALQTVLDDVEKDDTVRAMVLTGNGKAFCAGQDLKEVTSPEQNPGFKKILEEHYNPIIARIRSIEKPILAAVNGVAAGAGANIALACDVVIASEEASFIQAFSKIGLIPDSGGTFFLPRLIGFQKASAVMMLGDKVSASEAETLGMIYKVVAAEDLSEVIQKTATQLAMMPTKALGMTKRLLNESMTNNLETQLELEGKLQIEAAQSDDYAEGVDAFVNKRKPNFKGK